MHPHTKKTGAAMIFNYREEQLSIQTMEEKLAQNESLGSWMYRN